MYIIFLILNIYIFLINIIFYIMIFFLKLFFDYLNNNKWDVVCPVTE